MSRDDCGPARIARSEVLPTGARPRRQRFDRQQALAGTPSMGIAHDDPPLKPSATEFFRILDPGNN